MIARLVVLCRWALVPLFLGLAAALVLLVVAFLLRLWALAATILTASETEVVMGFLTLIDLTLIGALIVIVICSGYENFVEKIDASHGAAWPDWMKRVSFSGLKQKLFASMAAIAAVTLLKALMKLEVSVSEAQVKWLVVANFIFILAYGVLALIDHFTHQNHDRDGSGH